ncbi:hypothetical protein LXL04_003179 [Taraxacum kok-saghyz]
MIKAHLILSQTRLIFSRLTDFHLELRRLPATRKLRRDLPPTSGSSSDLRNRRLMFPLSFRPTFFLLANLLPSGQPSSSRRPSCEPSSSRRTVVFLPATFLRLQEKAPVVGSSKESKVWNRFETVHLCFAWYRNDQGKQLGCYEFLESSLSLLFLKSLSDFKFYDMYICFVFLSLAFRSTILKLILS